MAQLKMDEKWKEIHLEKLKNNLSDVIKDVEIDLIIDRETDLKSQLENVKWQNYNNYFIATSNSQYSNTHKSSDNSTPISIADILGSYSIEVNKHKITLYEKNIENVSAELKKNLLIVLQHLAICQVPYYIDRNHFPIEYLWAKDFLNNSKNFEDFISKISQYSEKELGFHKIELPPKQLLNFCQIEVFDSLFEVIFLHQTGHLVHNLSVYDKYEDFCNAEKEKKEAFADLFALFNAPSLKEKIIFFSIAQNSDYSWFKFYKKIYEDEKIFDTITILDKLMEVIK